MPFIEEKINILCKNLKEQARQTCGDVGVLEYVAAEGYKKGNTPPSDGWQELKPETEFWGKDAHYWVRGSFTSPSADEHHDLVLEAFTGKEGQWDATNPQGLLYLNGEMAQGYDTNHTECFLEPDTQYEMYNYLYMGMQDSPIRLRMRLTAIDRRIEKLYYDLRTPFEACLILDQNSREYIQMLAALEQAANLVDMRDVYSASYYNSIAEAEAFLEQELYNKLCSVEGKPVINYVGHTHIDMEWRWARPQTREKIQRSFATAAALMKRYPEYKFMLSQPGLYQYLKEEAPDKYEELRQLVRDGRWEAEGAMWVESDCNLVSGESFVRQILQGKQFFRDEFGVECRMLFLPDVFGYNAAMPQMLRKSGIDYFITSKISWNETNRLPVDEFMWQGIDGTEIFTSFITAQNTARNQEPKTYTTYNGTISSAMHKGAWDRFQQKAYGNRTLVTFGYGDGGGGPTKDMLEHYRRIKRGLPGLPAAEMGFIVPYLEKLKQEFDENCVRTKRTPRWVGELYMEMHRGTYTSMGKIKRDNRKSELMLQKAEGLSYTELLFGGGYDAEGLYRSWNKVLHNQFHDILPGDSIGSVYEFTDEDYAQIRAYCDGMTGRQMKDIAARVPAQEGMLVYNPLGFARSGMVTVDGRTVEIAEEIPAFGWKVLSPAQIAESCGRESAVTVSGRTIRNRYYQLTLDGAGRIASLRDLRADREVFRPGCAGNELQVFEDYPRKYDNFEITDYYKQKCWILDDEAEITPVYDGARAGLRIERKYLHSTIAQNVWLYTDSRRIDVDMEIDWHEHHQILKTAFPVDVNASYATYEIQFGHVQRPTHENTSWDQARFEVYGHKWVDIADNGYGLGLLNDCKYGYNTEGNTLKLTILKCGTDPFPEADQGRHVLTYSLMPHEGDFREADLIREAYALNQPLETALIPGTEAKRTPALPAEFSLASCDQPNVMLETIKKAEADDGMILRVYEAFNRRTKAEITVAEGFSRVWLCDLMENVIRELPFDGKKVPLTLSNFEIATLKFEKQN